MRLQLAIGVFLAVLGTASTGVEAQEAPHTESMLRIYSDDDHVTVVSPSLEAELDLGSSFDLGLGTAVDVVSAASVDVISQASPTAISEVRVEGSATLGWEPSRLSSLRTGAVVSHESDYDSLRPTLGAQFEIAQRNAIIDLAYTESFDRAGSVVDEEFSRSRRGHIASASFTQILDPRTYLDLIVDLRRFKGYHGSPYRKVPILSRESTAVLLAEERTPALRQSAAMLFRLRRALTRSAEWFVHASYRYYRDDWSIASHTLSAQLVHSSADNRLLLGLHLRGYAQNAADFYRAYYDSTGAMEIPAYRTRDRTLGGMRSLHASLTADAALSEASGARGWRLRTMLAAMHFGFLDFPAQRERNAITLGISLLAPL